nr:hypothetical protein GCM10020093_039280 [Planobispora longispora]
MDFAPEIAAAQGVKSTDLKRNGVVDRIVPEFPDAAYEPEAFCRRVAAALEYEIIGLLGQAPRTASPPASPATATSASPARTETTGLHRTDRPGEGGR